MGQYLMVENTGDLPKACILYAGSSTKRNDASSIGQFGTGLKFAAVLSLKLGLEFLIQTEDWQARPVVKPEKFTKNGKLFEINAIAYEFKYSNGDEEIVATSFTTEMGLNWTEEYQLVREIVCNGIDEKDFKHTITDDIVTVEPGKVRVYVEVNNAIKSIMDNFDYYFVFNQKPLYSNPVWGEVLAGETFTIYTKGVLIEDTGAHSIYRYNLPIELTEERKAAQSWHIERCIAKLWGSVNVPTIVETILKHGTRGGTAYSTEYKKVEWYYFRILDENKQLWADAFRSTFGKRAVMYTNPRAALMAVNLGYSVIELYESLAEKLLEQVTEIPADINVLGDVSLDYDYTYQPSADEVQVLEQALRVMRLYYPNLPEVRVFKPLSDAAHKVLGIVTDDNQIALNRSQLKSILTAVATINHERRHIDTGADDGQRAFIETTDDEIAQLMLEGSKANFSNVTVPVTAKGFRLPDGLRVTLNDTAHIAILNDKIIIFLGGYKFEAVLERGVGQSWAASKPVTVYNRGLYVNCLKSIRDKLPSEIIFSVR